MTTLRSSPGCVWNERLSCVTFLISTGANGSEIEPAELPTVVDKLSHLDSSYNEDLQGHVRDWGIFRAVIHQMVWEALQR